MFTSRIIIKCIKGKTFSFIKNNNIYIFVDSTTSLKTQFSYCIILAIHELTHISRFDKKVKFSANCRGDMGGYFLHPEEMIAFYNSIMLDSYIRNSGFENTLNYYINNFIKNKTDSEKVIQRFKKGMVTLNKKYKTLIYNDNMTKDDMIAAIERVEEEFKYCIDSIGRYAHSSIAPEDRESYIEEQLYMIDQLKKYTISKIEEEYELTIDKLSDGDKET